MKITFDVDLEKFRYSLVGDGYIEEEVVKMSEEELIEILNGRIYWYIERGYRQGKRYGLFNDNRIKE